MKADPRVPLKNPTLAAVLAFLLPGAGHFYQGRFFKGGLYSVCILGTFLTGMALGDWQVVYYRPDLPWRKATNLCFIGQAMVGAPALPAVVQARRFGNPQNHPQTDLDAPLTAAVDGELVKEGVDGETAEHTLRGQLRLEPADGFGGVVSGTFDGSIDGEQAVTLKLQLVALGREIEGDPNRGVRCFVNEPAEFEGWYLSGHIPRAFANWFEAPLEGEPLEKLHRRLGKFHELAVVYTLIAGLLNILAIWDALEGPAYGYGDESESDEKEAGSDAHAGPDGKDAKDNSQKAQQREAAAERSPPVPETSAVAGSTGPTR